MKHEPGIQGAVSHTPSSSHGRVVAVCITQAVQPRTASTRTQSGINKGPIEVATFTPTGVVGDKVLDTRHHGGVDKAVYAYADEDAAWWADQLEEPIPPGRFGENLRTAGIDLTAAVIGERWQIGTDVVVEVSEPRTPCATFRHHMGDRRGFVRRFTEAGRPGTYLRVIAGGEVRSGQPIAVVSRPDHGVSIGRLFSDADPEDARTLLDAEGEGWQMGPALLAHVERILARSPQG